MVQLRQDYQQFADRQAEVIIIGPDKPGQFKSFWEKNRIPFVGIPDPRHVIATQYSQPVKRLKLGRLPETVIIDRNGQIQYEHFGNSMKDIPDNRDLLEALDKLNQTANSL